MSCSTISIEELARTIPVSPPIVNKKINPIDQVREGLHFIRAPYRVPTHLNTLTPVGTAIIIVAAVK